MDSLQSLLTTLLGSIDLSSLGDLGTMKLLLAAVLMQAGLRVSAEALTRLSVKTDSMWDNKAAAALSTVSWYLGEFLGHFGIGTPTPVMQDRVETAMAEKAKDSQPDKP